MLVLSCQFEKLGEMSFGPTDLLLLNLFIFSSTERFVIEIGLLGGNIEVTVLCRVAIY